jgi:hypothetical protein
MNRRKEHLPLVSDAEAHSSAVGPHSERTVAKERTNAGINAKTGSQRDKCVAIRDI